MDLVQLRSFAEVAERGTIAAAATSLGYTGPAVSQHLAKLEAHLGTALFDRVGGRLSLTTAGAALVPIALEMLDLDARGRASVHHPAGPPRVVVAGFASALSTVLIPRLDRLRELVALEIVEAEDAEALRELGLGAVDVVLTQEYDGSPSQRNRRYTYTPLVTDRLVLVLPPDRGATTRIGELADAPWLVNGRATRCALATTRILDAAGIAPNIVAAVADNAALLALVAAGQGVTILPARVLDGSRPADVTIADQDLGVARTILAVTRTATTAPLVPLLDLLRGAPTR